MSGTVSSDGGRRRLYFVARHPLRMARLAPTPVTALRIRAADAALAFAVHPVRVECVVWVAERRDVVSGLFYFLAVLACLRWAEETSKRLR